MGTLIHFGRRIGASGAMMMIVALWGLSCGTKMYSQERLLDPSLADIHASVEVDAEAGPIAIITLKNLGSRPLAITRTFGLTDLYFRLEIKKGETYIGYPQDSEYEPYGEKYECLGPGKSVTFEIPLNRWYHYHGGQPELAREFSFGLTSGHYKMRAIYSSTDEYINVSCPVFGGPIRSSWTEVEIFPS